MKQILIILCFAVGFSSLNAQVVKSSSRKIVVQHVNASKDNIWYLKGGLSLMSLIDDYSDGAKLGYKFDWGFKKTIKRLKTNDSFNPYWGTDFSLGSMYGNKHDNSYFYYRENTEHFAHCLQLSLNLGFDFSFSDKVKLDVHAGNFLSLALFGDGDVLFDFDSGIGLGFNLGIGLWINSFNFEVGYQQSTADLGIEGSNIIFKVGFAIPEKHNSANR